jgi:hypothetical protein
MHNIDDCLLKTSISISIEGDADVGHFETQMENSFTSFVKTLGVQLISSSPRLWSFRSHQEMKAIGSERENATLWVVKHFLTTLPRYKDRLNDSLALQIAVAQVARREYPNWFLEDSFSDIELREAFASAINEGMITISYQGIVFRGLCLVVCFEFETLSNIYQYYWRSRWVLTLVNFLINSQKTSKRLSQKAAVTIRHFRKRLFRKPKLPV